MYYIFRCYQTFMSADIIQLKIIRLDNDSQCIRERDRESREREIETGRQYKLMCGCSHGVSINIIFCVLILNLHFTVFRT